MPKLNDEGQVINEDGELILIDEKPITVEDALPKSVVEQQIADRLARKDRSIEALKQHAEENPELKDTIAELTKERDELVTQSEQAQADAKKAVEKQMKDATDRAANLEVELNTERSGRVRDRVEVNILAEAKGFRDPATDVAPKLLNVHSREERTDAPGTYIDYFTLNVVDEDGKSAPQKLELGAALETWGKQHPHHVKSTGHSGPGSESTYVDAKHLNLKRSQMSVKEKTAFTTKHGHEAFMGLPA